MKEKLLLVLFFIVVVGGFVGITLSVAKVFVSNVNSVTASYFPGDDGIKE
jgi:general stress protein CsbA